ncbi:hypothetical protein A3841_02495 [Pontibacter flavimaris]|uniref:Uncharacterized protein n=1 Tax=Pontibacter flavimaris TaxID=1797110 RepID=A0A1Q5PB13_9BACT|nr:hypothetical protein A3841_02495 [Pontibacter flavimaris]
MPHQAELFWLLQPPFHLPLQELLHFMFPVTMPLLHVRVAECLYKSGLTRFQQRLLLPEMQFAMEEK